MLIFLSFLQIASEVLKNYEAFFARYGLSAGKLTILILLQRELEAGLTPSECADHAGVSRGTITGLLDGLERQGLIKREPHPTDGRMMRIHLSEAGLNLLETVLPEHFERTAELMSALSEAERQTLKGLINKLQTQMSQL